MWFVLVVMIIIIIRGNVCERSSESIEFGKCWDTKNLEIKVEYQQLFDVESGR